MPDLGSGNTITADVRTLYMDAPITKDTDVGNRKPSAMPDRIGYLCGEKTGNGKRPECPCLGSVDRAPIYSLHVYMRVRWDEDGSLCCLYR